MAHEIDTGVAGIKARELTVKQARALLKGAADRAREAQTNPDGFDQLAEQLFEDMTFYDIAAITGCEMDRLDELTESELRKIADACKKANPSFFAMKEREQKQMRTILEKNPDLLKAFMTRSKSESTDSK